MRVRRLVRILLGLAILAFTLGLLRRLGAPPVDQSAASRPGSSPLPAVPLGRRLPFVLLPAAMLAGGVFFLTVAAPRLQAAQPPAPPTQPIAFDHRVHNQAAGLDCAFCHRTAAIGLTAGLLEIQLCMACHQTIGQG